MEQTRRFKFFGLGALAGIFLVVLFFGRRNSCKNYIRDYMPNGRVLAEVKFLPIKYDPQAMEDLKNLKIDTAYINQKALVDGDIDFDLSDQRHKPCGQYVLYYKDSLKNVEINFKKCKKEVVILSVK